MLHKAIKGYEDYLVTDTGQVYSLKTGKYLKASKDSKGYMRVDLYKNGKKCTKKVHRLVAKTFIPNPENKLTVDHINRIKDDNRVENLRWATSSEQVINQSHEKRVAGMKRKYGQPIVEKINDEVSIGYLSLREVPNINKRSLQNHIYKGETDFYVHQKNGNVRHFMLPKN